MTRLQWRWAFAAQLRREANATPYRLRERMHDRARKFIACASFGKFRQCEDCKEIEPGTGRVWSQYPCHCRGCDYCARVKADQDADELIAAMGLVPHFEGYDWRHIVLGFERDPSDPMLHTAEALRARCLAILDGGKRLWDEMLGAEHHPGAAMRAKVECADEGHVHLHIAYYGPFVPKAKLEKIVASVPPPPGCEWGFSWIERVRVGEDGLAREVAKYVTKGPSAKSEGWLAGERRWVMDPTLAARWEIATQGLKTSRTYGALRGEGQPEAPCEDQSNPPEVEASEPKDAEFCQACCFGRMQTVVLPLEETIWAMHARGQRALRGSRWTPRREAEPDG